MIIKGTLLFQKANLGSKSEGIYPFIVTEDGERFRVTLVGDNPFENSILKTYESKKVILDGDFNENGKLIATKIEDDQDDNESAETN